MTFDKNDVRRVIQKLRPFDNMYMKIFFEPYGEKIRTQSMEKGIEKGMEEGIIKGMEKGRAEGEARGIIRMCTSFKMDVDEIVEKLVDMLGMSQTQAREAALMYA